MQNYRCGALAPEDKSCGTGVAGEPCASPRALGVPTDSPAAPSVPLATSVPRFHLFWSTQAFLSLFMSIDCLPANTHCKNHTGLGTEVFHAASAVCCWRGRLSLHTSGTHGQACGLVKCRLVRLDCYLNLHPYSSC